MVTMLTSALKVFSGNERQVNKLRPMVARINALEPRVQEYTDEQLRETTSNLRERLEKGDSLDSLIPEAFAAVREAARRVLKMRHFDVQLMGGLVLHQGRIAEMRTGEGKTLVATCPLFVNALTGKGAHLVTVNPYLAKRDATWMGAVFHALGMSVGILQHESSLIYDPDFDSGDPHWPHVRPASRKEAYDCDITYGMNSEYAFDYLRDNMSASLEDCVQRSHHFAIVDEVDSILIDEARTPHIISGQGMGDVSLYDKVDKVVAHLKDEVDYTVEEKQKSAMLTEEGTNHCERLLGVRNLADPEMHELMHHVQASLKARYCFRRDVDYVVRDNEVVIVDEFTGRLMPGRRWSDGLHQAVEAKEGVKIEQENQTVATITIQNFFRLYEKLGGMTGTAKTEEGEFRKIYGLDVVQVPTNLPIQRKDHPDIVFKSMEIKYRGVTEEILKTHVRRQPVLVGTRSIEISERLSRRLSAERLQLLSAISLLRNRIENDKLLSAEEKTEYHTFLNRRLHDPLDDLPPGQRMMLGADGVPLLLPAEADDLPVDTGPRLRGLRDLATMAAKVTPRLSLNMLEDENLKELAQWLGIADEGDLHERLTECLATGVPHEVLNAKNHEREAAIIAEAGRLGAVTIATNMAGRGVDILLGGKDNPEAAEEASKVRDLGGLHIVGSERHESRRIDNQLRGRAGRQGDPGSSRYFVSLEDELWRLFGDRTKSFGMNLWDEWLPIDNKVVTFAIERTQKKVELYHFDIRKHTLQYDEVLNEQRTIIYKERRKILEGADLKSNIETYIREVVSDEVDKYCSTEVHQDEWDYKGLWDSLNGFYPLLFHAPNPKQLESRSRSELVEFLTEAALKQYEEKEAELTPELLRQIERMYALDFLTNKWMEHLDAMDYLREGIGLRGYAQVDPVMAYRQEGENYFQQLVGSWKRDLISAIYHTALQPQQPEIARMPQRPMRMVENISGEDGHDPITEMSRGAAPASESPARPIGGPRGVPPAGRPADGDGDSRTDGSPDAAPARISPRVRADRGLDGLATGEKIGRNDLCPCGSGKKYKKCHGVTAGAAAGQGD